MTERVHRLLGALSLSGLAFSAWWGWAGTRGEDCDGGWKLTDRPIELTSAELLGPLRNNPGAMELSALQGAQAPVALRPGDTVELDAELPEGGSILVKTGQTVGIQAPNGRPPPGAPNAGGPTSASGPSPGGGGPSPGGGGPTPDGPPPGGQPGGTGAPGTEKPTPGVLFDFAGRRDIRGVGGLQCTPIALPSGHIHATIEVGNSGATVHSGSETMTCSGERLAGPWMLRSGVSRVRVNAVAIRSGDTTKLRFTGAPWWRGGVGGALMAGMGAVLGLTAVRREWLARALAPLALGPFVAWLPAGRWLEAMRMLAFPEALLPVVVTGIAAALALYVGLASRVSLGKILGAGALPTVLCLTLVLRYPDAPGWAVLCLGFVAWAGIAWVNVRRVAGVGLWSWLGILLALGSAEVGLRRTQLTDTWIRTVGYERAAKEFQELLELKQYRSYPSEGFPVRPSEPRPGVHRIVAFGGSSTGGAFQMDNLDYFWPKQLENRLSPSGWEVLNQGVGGWNTLHIRLYAESQLDRLKPDILALYVGHNDLFTRGVASHKQLLTQYREGGKGAVAAIDSALHASRLFVGFKFFVLSWRGDAAVAVPVADARENLTAILELAKERHIHVLLMTEALNPDATPMEGYAALEAQLAAEFGQASFDAARAFSTQADPDDFLDDCHLSVTGHQRLAGWIEDQLRAVGWLPAAGPIDAPAPSPG